MAVDTTTYLADAKIVYGAIQNQVSTKAAIMNLFGDGSKFGKPINNIGIRGYVFLARLGPNWDLGFRAEGTTGVGAAGNQGLAQATVSLKYAYVPISITGQAHVLTKGEGRAFMQAKALEAKYDMEDVVSHANVIVAGAERGGQLATVAAPAAGSFTADNAGNLPGAIYLRVGQPIDTNAVGGGALTLSSAKITAINYTTRVVTVPGTAVAGQAVTLGKEAALTTGAFPLTVEGLQSLINDTGAIQGLDPAVAGQESWKAFKKDASAATISSPLIHELCQYVQNRGGLSVDVILSGSSQINQLTNIATQTLRFDVTAARTAGQKRALDLGFSAWEYAGKMIVEDKDIRTDRIFAIVTETLKKFEAAPLSLADDEAGEWTRIFGASGIADAVGGLLRWYFQIGTLQRSSSGMLFNLAVPTTFATQPPTL